MLTYLLDMWQNTPLFLQFYLSFEGRTFLHIEDSCMSYSLLLLHHKNYWYNFPKKSTHSITHQLKN